MKTFTTQAAQGDLLITRVDAIPSGMTPVPAEGGQIIVAHSETGHHHAFAAHEGVTYVSDPSDPTTCYLSIAGDGAELMHHRPHDTHESLFVAGGCYRLTRQREHTPEGWRMIQD